MRGAGRTRAAASASSGIRVRPSLLIRRWVAPPLPIGELPLPIGEDGWMGRPAMIGDVGMAWIHDVW